MDSPQRAVHRRTFFVGGHYAGPPEARVMRGQMFVEALTPERVLHPYPLVLTHGGGQTANTWLTTPDGREGWADHFVRQGWAVYLVDQPARGRSAWQPGLDGELTAIPVPYIERLFTACADYDDWPQGRLHTQWPGGQGKGHPGDPVFDQFYAAQVPWLGRSETETAVAETGAALLDRIGPAVLLVHSQAGTLAWLMADARPDLVKAIVAIEPSGPPHRDEVSIRKVPDRPWGLTFTPLTYDPPVTAEDPLAFEKHPPPEGSVGLQPGWLQAAPPRPLAHLKDIPVLVVTGEASYHAAYDHCTVAYLAQAGVRVEHLRLEAHGVHGNGHMMMMELNSAEIAALLESWMDRTLAAQPSPGSTPV